MLECDVAVDRRRVTIVLCDARSVQRVRYVFFRDVSSCPLTLASAETWSSCRRVGAAAGVRQNEGGTEHAN